MAGAPLGACRAVGACTPQDGSGPEADEESGTTSGPGPASVANPAFLRTYDPDPPDCERSIMQTARPWDAILLDFEAEDLRATPFFR